MFILNWSLVFYIWLLASVAQANQVVQEDKYTSMGYYSGEREETDEKGKEIRLETGKAFQFEVLERRGKIPFYIHVDGTEVEEALRKEVESASFYQFQEFFSPSDYETVFESDEKITNKIIDQPDSNNTSTINAQSDGDRRTVKIVQIVRNRFNNETRRKTLVVELYEGRFSSVELTKEFDTGRVLFGPKWEVRLSANTTTLEQNYAGFGIRDGEQESEGPIAVFQEPAKIEKLIDFGAFTPAERIWNLICENPVGWVAVKYLESECE